VGQMVQCNVSHRECGICCAKTAELMELPFGMLIRECLRSYVLDWHTQWRHVANTVKQLRMAWFRIILGNLVFAAHV